MYTQRCDGSGYSGGSGADRGYPIIPIHGCIQLVHFAPRLFKSSPPGALVLGASRCLRTPLEEELVMDILSSLRLVNIGQLELHEDHEPSRLTATCAAIQDEGVLRHPL